MGGSLMPSPAHFIGAIDELTLYNRVLTPSEIESIYLADFAGKCTQPPVIISFARYDNGNVHFEFFNQSGQPWQVEVSTDLMDWHPAGMANYLSNGRFGFDETNTLPASFYRLVNSAGP